MTALSRPRPVRILHVSQPGDGGVGRVVAGLASWQAAQGHEVVVAADPASQLAAEVSAQVGLAPWVARRSPVRGVPRELAALRRIISDADPDVVHLHSSKAGLIGRLALRRRRPTLYQPHGWSFYAATGPLGAAATAWERHGARWADEIICVSEMESTRGRDAIGVQATVVPNGVDTSWWAPRDRAEARSRLGVPAGALLVVCVGRYDAAKGHLPFAPVWRRIRELRPGAELVLVGNGPLEREVRDAYRDAGTRLVTDCTDSRDWLAAADVVVAPSLWEGGALAPIEAMSMARPVVGYDVGGLAQTLGEPGLAVAPQDGEALTAALLDAQERPDLGDRLRGRAVSDFDSAITYRRLTDTALARVEFHP